MEVILGTGCAIQGPDPVITYAVVIRVVSWVSGFQGSVGAGPWPRSYTQGPGSGPLAWWVKDTCSSLGSLQRWPTLVFSGLGSRYEELSSLHDSCVMGVRDIFLHYFRWSSAGDSSKVDGTHLWSYFAKHGHCQYASKQFFQWFPSELT